MFKYCGFCGKMFKTLKNNNTICGIQCRRELQRRRSREYSYKIKGKRIKKSVSQVISEIDNQ